METKASITPLTMFQRIMVIMVGFVFIAVAIYIYADIFNFGKGVHTTEGTIVSLIEERYRSPGTRSATGTVYRPVVEFTVKEKKYKFLSKSGSYGYKIGESIRVNYDPKNPSDSARLAGKKELFWPAVAGLCGAIAVLLGFLAPSKKNVPLEN
jgi:cytochrome c oxidase assembly protein Cox11